jgi:hypothetical protein
MGLSLPYISFTVFPFTILSICQPRKALHLYMCLSLCWKVHRRHCVTWENRTKQKYARAVNYFDWQAHGFVITVLCYLLLLLPFRRAVYPDATATACCFQGWPTCIQLKINITVTPLGQSEEAFWTSKTHDVVSPNSSSRRRKAMHKYWVW